MTDSELLERLEEALEQIREAIEERGGLLELDRKPDFRWAGVARMPAGKLMIQSQKTGKQAAPDSKKRVAEAITDLTLEGRFLGRLLFYADNTEVELPGGAHRPLDHSGVAKIFSAM
jgi:vacuolar-type H+-ATPase subunit E/Vma4